MTESPKLTDRETFTCKSPDETYDLGVRIARDLMGGEILLLSGALGAGKTLFAKGVAEGLGFDPDEVSSPSFTLVNAYDARLPVFHIDLWRLEDPATAAAAVGLHDILEDESAVVMIEWPERLGEIDLPGRVIDVSIEGDGDEARTVAIKTRL